MMAPVAKTENVFRSGTPLGVARAVVILIHGRGARAQDMFGLADAFGQNDIAYVAPQAEGGSWYPQSFLAPIAQNEPFLSDALGTIDAVVEDLRRSGMKNEKIVVAGFSQGACLALEYAAQNATRYGGVLAFSGGLIGPEGMPRNYSGSLADTPIFLGCSDIDFHIPLKRVNESSAVMKGLGGNVTEAIYPGMGHTIIQDEIEHAKAMLGGI
jgi:phospholipase/carboxylesterase